MTAGIIFKSGLFVVLSCKKMRFTWHSIIAPNATNFHGIASQQVHSVFFFNMSSNALVHVNKVPGLCSAIDIRKTVQVLYLANQLFVCEYHHALMRPLGPCAFTLIFLSLLKKYLDGFYLL